MTKDEILKKISEARDVLEEIDTDNLTDSELRELDFEVFKAIDDFYDTISSK